MSYKDIQSGDKKARPTGARFIKSSGDTPGIEVKFEFLDPNSDTIETLSWVGWLSPKAKENTMDTLVNVLGCNGDESVNAEGSFTHPKFLNWENDVTLVVELEAAQDSSGNAKLDNEGNQKFYPNIKWVNTLGGSAYANCTPDVVKSELAASGFRACFLSVRKSSGQPTTTQQDPSFADPTQLNVDDIPF